MLFCVQLTPAPSSLVGPLRDLFNEQENARHQLKLQHIKERVSINRRSSFQCN
jgi:hypothetical protein